MHDIEKIAIPPEILAKQGDFQPRAG